ncbi:endochitinase-like [Anopheles bellator]|uniref:endochitinase-like n=1 Tax=Anopheles bellator TaxID=139047 RepID=UPI00264A1323|nr:endochitinase-like [Anopheles bellator]
MDLHRKQRRTIRSECLLTLLLLCWFLPEKAVSARRHLVCMYRSYTATPSKAYQIEDIPMDLCTHILYYGSKIDPTDNELEPWDGRHDILERGYQKFADIKNRQPDVKLLMSVLCTIPSCGRVAASSDTRKALIESAIRLLRRYNLDGLSYEWRYPPQEAKQDYATLIEETKQAFKNAGHDTWTVSVDVPGREDSIAKAFDQQRICCAADFVILWVDRRFSSRKNTDIPSPLYRRRFETGVLQRYNIMDGTQHWINSGCPRDKILLKVAASGMKFALDDASDHSVNATRDLGQFPEHIEYNQICSRLRDAGWTVDWDERSKAPFAYRGKECIGYENEVSLEDKAYFVDGEGLGGLVVESIDQDDYKGVCGKKYPLLTALWKAYRPTWSTDDDPFDFAIHRST